MHSAAERNDAELFNSNVARIRVYYIYLPNERVHDIFCIMCASYSNVTCVYKAR